MKNHKHTVRFRIAVKAADLIMSPRVPRSAKKWIIRAFKQEYDEIRYLLEIGNRPEGIRVRRT